jgi:hypothetical protein
LLLKYQFRDRPAGLPQLREVTQVLLDASPTSDKGTAKYAAWSAALAWLRDDLAAYHQLAKAEGARPAVRQRLAHRQQDADLASARDREAPPLDRLTGSSGVARPSLSNLPMVCLILIPGYQGAS